MLIISLHVFLRIFLFFRLMTSELMSTLNMDGHGDKTDRKGGEKQEKHLRNDVIVVRGHCMEISEMRENFACTGNL
jgi:hypothetical protein